MNRLCIRLARTILLSSCALLFTAPSWAQTAAGYPNKAVKVIVPFPPSGFADVVGRLLAQGLAARWGQAVLVENRGGAGGIIAAEAAAKAPPDGYTLFWVSDGPLAINPFIYKTLPYDPVNDFAPVALVAGVAFALVVSTERVKAKTVSEFVAEARARAANPMAFASSGVGSPHQMAMETFKSLANFNVTHVPYKGGALALTAVAAGEVDVSFSGLATSAQLAKSGKLRVLGFSALKRSPLAPDVPTIDEQGYPGFESVPWTGVVVPKATPQAIVDRLEVDVLNVARDPQFIQKLYAAGGEPIPGTAAEFREKIRKDYQRFGKLIRDLNIPVQ